MQQPRSLINRPSNSFKSHGDGAESERERQEESRRPGSSSGNKPGSWRNHKDGESEHGWDKPRGDHDGSGPHHSNGGAQTGSSTWSQ